jgi:hypothetical protein
MKKKFIRSIFERALKNNPPRKDEETKQPIKRKKMADSRTTRSKTGSN